MFMQLIRKELEQTKQISAFILEAMKIKLYDSQSYDQNQFGLQFKSFVNY